MRRLILIVISLGLMGLSSADYYIVEPDGRVYRAEKTERGWKPINGLPSDPEEPNPQWVDTIFWHDTESAGWYYPNRDSNTVVLQYFNFDWPCSLMAVGISFYSAGWADFYVWEGPDPLPATSSELEAHFCSTWVYDDDVSSWVTMPNILLQGSIGTEDPPDDLVSRTAWIDISPGVDLRTDHVLVGYRILTRTNPDGEPYGGEPWPQSDGWYDPLGRGPHWTPCRSWMFRVQESSGLHLTWTEYGDVTGDWGMYYVIDIYENVRPVISDYTRILGSYDLSARTISVDIRDVGVPAESSGVNEAWLLYYLDDDLETLDSVEMVLTGGDSTSGVWKATIPAQSPNTEVTYYFRISDIQGACSTDYPSWSYFLGEGNPDHVLLHIGSLIDYGLHDPVRAVRSRVDVWDEKARGAADSTVFEYYTTRAGERGIIWLHWTGARMVEDTAYVRRFLDAGGSLLISSQDLVADFDLWYGPPPYSHWQANPIVSPFCYNYLQLRSGWDDWEAIDTLTSFPAHGVPGDPITGSLPDISVTPASNWTGIFDSVSMGSNEIFHGPRSTIIGFRYEGTHKLIFLYWHFHEIGTGAGKEFEPDTASQNEFMRNALTWLNLTVGVDQTTADIGRSYFLSQNIPNPASEGRTTISYSLPRRERVSLLVYDIAGRRVKKVVDGIKGSGLHQAAWEGGDDLGRQVSQGVYFYRLSAGDFTSTKKMIWLR